MPIDLADEEEISGRLAEIGVVAMKNASGPFEVLTGLKLAGLVLVISGNQSGKVTGLNFGIPEDVLPASAARAFRMAADQLDRLAVAQAQAAEDPDAEETVN